VLSVERSKRKRLNAGLTRNLKECPTFVLVLLLVLDPGREDDDEDENDV
jgi:hypothetical protein